MPIQGTIKDDYTWAELRSPGAGPRQFTLKGPGVNLSWTVTPNPHHNPDYNNNGQTKLYQGFAKALEAGWPTKKEAKAAVITEPQDVKDAALKKKLLALSKQKFDAFAKEFNQKAKATAEAAAKADYASAVAKHVAAKAQRASFTLGDITYKLKKD